MSYETYDESSITRNLPSPNSTTFYPSLRPSSPPPPPASSSAATPKTGGVSPPSPPSLHPHPKCITPPHCTLPYLTRLAIHITTPITPAALIAPYTSTIAPSIAYLADPLIAYTHLGHPIAFVHLLGPLVSHSTPASQATTSASECGCLLNAVLCPIVLCLAFGPNPRQLSSTGDTNNESNPKPWPMPPEPEGDTALAAVFA
ncbi:hypothetical protein D9615_010698 [Tricholomella constricta]|uniref:Uncharacterized protein n=1 Tax=Tricholomella constricta TaxID=117010 RepID=A0A8H5GJ46_9AGAR|nr:hypothetical protein D9615_010698 [Tricholomella constricta]